MSTEEGSAEMLSRRLSEARAGGVAAWRRFVKAKRTRKQEKEKGKRGGVGGRGLQVLGNVSLVHIDGPRDSLIIFPYGQLPKK